MAEFQKLRTVNLARLPFTVTAAALVPLLIEGLSKPGEFGHSGRRLAESRIAEKLNILIYEKDGNLSA